MSDKQAALEYIQQLAASQLVTKAEVVKAFEAGVSQPEANHQLSLNKKFGITEILYYLGGGVVFLGIATLISQNWTELNVISKLLTTLGVGLGSYVVGVIFSQDERTHSMSPAFYLISALVMPIGLYTVLDTAGVDATTDGAQVLISGTLVAMVLSSYLIFKNVLFKFFTVIFATWLFFSLTNFIIGDTSGWEFYEYRVLAIGLSYILFGYSEANTGDSHLSGLLYSLGVFSCLGAAMSLGGWTPNQSLFWEMIFPVLVALTLYFSVQLKSKAFLVGGTFYLMSFILKITGEYFSDSLGWSLTLVLAGLGMIGVGYLSLTLRKKVTLR